MGILTSGCKWTGLSISSNSMKLLISISSVAWSLPSRPSAPSSPLLIGRFLKVGVNDETWVVVTSDVLSGFWVYEYLISPTIFGGGETWSGCEVRFCWAELDSMSL